MLLRLSQKYSGQDLKIFNSPLALAALVFFLSVIIYGSLLLILPTSVFATANGVWKMIDAREWAEGNGQPVAANMAFTAVATTLYELSHGAGITPTRLLAVFNSIAMALTASILFLTLLRIRLGRSASFFWSVAFIVSGGALTHALGSEDIAGVLPLIALLLYLLTFNPIVRNNVIQIAFLGTLLALIHLWEWRAALPAYSAFLGYALLLMFQERSFGIFKRVLVLLSSWFAALFIGYVTISAVFSLSVGGYNYSRWKISPLRFIDDFALFLFPGKGVGTAWGGLSTDKFGYQAIGLIEAVVGGRNVTTLAFEYSLVVLAAVAVVLGLATLGAMALFKNRRIPDFSVVAVFYLFAALLLNLYSQPQDPQMNVTQLALIFSLSAYGWSTLLTKTRVKGFAPVLLQGAPIPALTVLLISPLNFQGDLSFWSQPHKTDSVALSEARALVATVEESNAALFGLGWESEVAWISLAGGRLNHVGYFPRDTEDTVAIFAVDFIFGNPDGRPSEWVCGAWKELDGRNKQRLVAVGQNFQGVASGDFSGFRTIIDVDRVREYEVLWAEAFVLAPEGGSWEFNETWVTNNCER